MRSQGFWLLSRVSKLFSELGGGQGLSCKLSVCRAVLPQNCKERIPLPTSSFPSANSQSASRGHLLDDPVISERICASLPRTLPRNPAYPFGVCGGCLWGASADLRQLLGALEGHED